MQIQVLKKRRKKKKNDCERREGSGVPQSNLLIQDADSRDTAINVIDDFKP